LEELFDSSHDTAGGKTITAAPHIDRISVIKRPEPEIPFNQAVNGELVKRML